MTILRDDITNDIQRWVERKQKILDRLLIEEPENYIMERMKIQQRYEAIILIIADLYEEESWPSSAPSVIHSI